MKKIRIGDCTIGSKKTFVIAEIGSNHDGSMRQAKALIAAARDSGSDAVKFQSFKAENLVVPGHAAFKKLRQLELPLSWHRELKRYADRQRILFFSTAFDEERALLLNSIGVPAFKISSGDLTFKPLIQRIARFKKPILLSTGMATIPEIEAAIRLITALKNDRIVLLHCVSNYPTEFKDANLKALMTLRRRFHLPVGLSDHSLGISVPLAAVSLGAAVIEKHFTLSRKLTGPDHGFALEPDELKEMIARIRAIEQALGDGKKIPRRSEIPERKWARRGIYAQEVISKGSVITKDRLAFLRPFHGLSPSAIDSILGGRTKVTIKKGMPVTISQIQK